MVGRVVVVGGGVAGVSTAAALRAGGFDGALTLVDAGEFPYDRPPLSKDFLARPQDLAAIALQPESWYDEQSVRLLNRTTVTTLRQSEGAVELSDGSLLPADRVVVATGGRAARLPIPGADHPRVHVLRTAEDAQRLREALVPGATVLVVGAGLIGAEVASTASELGCDVTLADPVCPPLTSAFGEEVAAWLHGVHAERGVKTVDSGVSTLEETDADVVVLGVGMVPETTLAETAGLEVDRGIVVDAGQVTSNPAVLAVGDPARTRRAGVLLPRAEHWEAAQFDGQRAAATILDAPVPAATAPWFWTDRHGLHIEAVGDLHSAAATILRGQLGRPPFAAFGLSERRVVGAVTVDDPMSARAARRLIDRAVDVDPDRLADPATDLRKLLRG